MLMQRPLIELCVHKADTDIAEYHAVAWIIFEK
jgi:hypothetical protein